MIDPIGLHLSPPVYLADPVNRHHPLNRGRAAWWLVVPGIEGGQYFYDLMGLNPGVLTGLTTGTSGWRSRQGGLFGAIRFDTTANQLVSIAKSVQFDTGAFSISGWVRFTSTGSTRQWWGSGLTVANTGEVTLYVTSGNLAGLFVKSNTGGTNQVSITGGSALNDGAWHRIVATRNGNSCTLFVDGVQVATGTASSSLGDVDTAGATTNIGNVYSGGRTFDGDVDDVSVWTRDLSAAEVRADYDLSRAGYPGVLNRVSPSLGASVDTVSLMSGRSFTRSSVSAAASGAGAMLGSALSRAVVTAGASGIGALAGRIYSRSTAWGGLLGYMYGVGMSSSLSVLSAEIRGYAGSGGGGGTYAGGFGGSAFGRSSVRAALVGAGSLAGRALSRARVRAVIGAGVVILPPVHITVSGGGRRVRVRGGGR